MIEIPAGRANNIAGVAAPFAFAVLKTDQVVGTISQAGDGTIDIEQVLFCQSCTGGSLAEAVAEN